MIPPPRMTVDMLAVVGAKLETLINADCRNKAWVAINACKWECSSLYFSAIYDLASRFLLHRPGNMYKCWDDSREEFHGF